MENYFADNLKKLRQNKKLSQNKLGEKVGYNQTTIARWEDKEMSPSVENVLKLADLFDVDLATLLGREIKIENGVIINPYFGIVRIPVYDPNSTNVPISYEDVPEDYTKTQDWLALKMNEDNEVLNCKADDLVLIAKQATYSDQDTVVYSEDDKASFTPAENTEVLGIVKEIRRKI